MLLASAQRRFRAHALDELADLVADSLGHSCDVSIGLLRRQAQKLDDPKHLATHSDRKCQRSAPFLRRVNRVTRCTRAVRYPLNFFLGPHSTRDASAARERLVSFYFGKRQRRLAPGCHAFEYLRRFIDHPDASPLPIQTSADHFA